MPRSVEELEWSRNKAFERVARLKDLCRDIQGQARFGIKNAGASATVLAAIEGMCFRALQGVESKDRAGEEGRASDQEVERGE